MVEFNIILESCRVLRSTHSFPEVGSIGLPTNLNLWGSEAIGLVGSEGIEPVVEDKAPWGWEITWGCQEQVFQPD